MDEFDAMKTVDKTLTSLDEATRARVLKWAWEKFGSPEVKLSGGDQSEKKPKKKNGKKVKKTISIVKDLNLRPKGKKSFIDFANEKKPTNHIEMCTVAVYYLQHEMEFKGISPDHVFTCYKNAGWRTPADIVNKLAVTAYKGLLDTSDFKNIRTASHGENLVEHDLPKGGKK